MKCLKCGNEVINGFCEQCGLDVSSEKTNIVKRGYITLKDKDYTNDVNLDEDYYYNGFYDPDSLQNIYDKFEYYYNYLYKEDNEIRGQITFYFDDEDKVISIVYEYGDVETLYKK